MPFTWPAAKLSTKFLISKALMVYWILPKLCYLGWEAIFRTDCLQSALHNVAWSIWGRLISLRVLFLDPTCSMFSWMILTKDCDNLLFEVGPRHQAVWRLSAIENSVFCNALWTTSATGALLTAWSSLSVTVSPSSGPFTSLRGRCAALQGCKGSLCFLEPKTHSWSPNGSYLL